MTHARRPSATPGGSTEARDLLDFIDAAPSPFHVVDEVARRLTGDGFVEVRETDRWPTHDGGQFLRRGGALVAWVAGPAPAPTGFRLVGAHTDSPNLRIKPRPDTGRAGYRQLGVEVYGGALLNSWLDRDLGLSGRVAVREVDGVGQRLLRIDRPLLRVPQLAIHLDRDIDQRGLLLNRQTHLSPVWGLGAADEGSFRRLLANELEIEGDEVLAWDVMAHDLSPSTLLGLDEEFISAPRLDDLCSCWAGTVALGRAAKRPGRRTPVLCLFDHEEVGSTSERGAGGPLLIATLERLVAGRGGTGSDLRRALAASFCASADMAHAVHPNYVERSEPDHQVAINGGPVIKVNTNQRYATDAVGAATFRLACEVAGVPVQDYVNRSDLPCGSTIGPLTAATLGIPTVDVGVAQLAMHSARELTGAADPARFAAALTCFLD